MLAAEAVLTLSLISSVFAADSATKPAAAPAVPADQAPNLQAQYKEAFNFYTGGEYQKAVLKWEQILQKNPDQDTARDMIAKARRMIWRVTRQRQQQITGFIGKGQYQKAQVSLQPLLDLDPDDPRLISFRQRLQNVVEIAPALETRDGPSRAVRTGLAAFLDFDPDYQLAYDAMRYALEKTGGNALFQRFQEMILADQPQLSKDEITPGMTLIAYMQHNALSDIYDVRYTEAVKVLREVVALEPDNVTALERLGSSYYCLGLKAQAKQTWRQALQISPDDPGLKKFLARHKPLKCGSH